MSGTFEGATLRQWRHHLGLNSRDAAERLGCSRAAYLGWEAGKQPVPRYIALATIALAYGLDVSVAAPERGAPRAE